MWGLIVLHTKKTIKFTKIYILPSSPPFVIFQEIK
jgi:hypothetical protein